MGKDSNADVGSVLQGGGAANRLERATWDSRVIPSRLDVGALIESHAYLLAAMADIASSARGSGPYARDRDADTLAMIERVAIAAKAKGTPA